MNLPVDIPWKLIAVSPDMMDTQFCNKKFPFAWRSSMAVSVHEPRLEDLPEELCGSRVTFVKVTASITGYQPSDVERTVGYASFGDVPTEQLDDVFGEYFGCYGVLLNVAVFPTSRVIRRMTSRKIDFSTREPETALPNPYQQEGATVRAADRETCRIVEWPAAAGRGSLALARELTVVVPTCDRVVAHVSYRSSPDRSEEEPSQVRMTAYKDGKPIASRATGSDPGKAYELALEDDGIDAVVFTTGVADASLLDFRYDVSQETPVGVRDYPHIVDFEPKQRDLYQGVTEEGEILTASASSAHTDKSYSYTQSTETGLALGSKAKVGSNGIGSESSSALSHRWGDTTQDMSSVQSDASRDRRERQATNTSLSQMYNLLTGYHAGTNRAVFVMLPRPHVLQPTDHRTFIRGLRFIEGMQDFFLIVTRPMEIEGLCIETTLETGHFPEQVDVVEPVEEFDSVDFPFDIFERTNNCFVGPCSPKPFDFPFSVPTPWAIDFTKGDRGHPGITLVQERGNKWTQDTRVLNYAAISDTTAHAWGSFRGEGGLGPGGILDMSFVVHAKKPKPKPTDAGKVVTPFFITSRGLCTCFRSGPTCPEVLEVGFPVPDDQPPVDVATPGEGPSPGTATPAPPVVIGTFGMMAVGSTSTSAAYDAAAPTIVDERAIEIDRTLLSYERSHPTRLPLLKEVLRKVHIALSTSQRLSTRRPVSRYSFLESDYFRDRLRRVLPAESLSRPVARVPNVPARVAAALGEDTTVGQALALNLAQLAKQTGLSPAAALALRRRLLGLRDATVGRAGSESRTRQENSGA
ncbi:MAG: hypothetical protein IPI02_11950 [Sterolibacteriaceae bacterium]|nr:hypothetical protein [Sterolibacteriaceae bacterium]